MKFIYRTAAKNNKIIKDFIKVSENADFEELELLGKQYDVLKISDVDHSNR